MIVLYRSIALMTMALTWISAAAAAPYDASAKKALDWQVQQRNPVDGSRGTLTAAQTPTAEEARQELGALAPVLFEANLKVALLPVTSGDWITAGYSARGSVCVIGYNPLSNGASLL